MEEINKKYQPNRLAYNSTHLMIFYQKLSYKILSPFPKKENLIFDGKFTFFHLAIIANYQRAAEFPWRGSVSLIQRPRRDRKFSARGKWKKEVATIWPPRYYPSKISSKPNRQTTGIFMIDISNIRDTISRPGPLIDPFLSTGAPNSLN